MSWAWRMFYTGCGFVAGCLFTLAFVQVAAAK